MVSALAAVGDADAVYVHIDLDVLGLVTAVSEACGREGGGAPRLSRSPSGPGRRVSTRAIAKAR